MCLFSSGRKCLLWGLLPALFFGGGQEKAAAAESPRTLSPFIQSIFPRGGRQGTEVEISIQGKYLGGACEIRFSGTGVKGKVLDASESQVKALVNISPDAPVGRRDLRVLTPRGAIRATLSSRMFTSSVLPQSWREKFRITATSRRSARSNWATMSTRSLVSKAFVKTSRSIPTWQVSTIPLPTRLLRNSLRPININMY